MSTEPTRAEIEASRDKHLDQLSWAMARRRQVALAVATGKADEATLQEAEQSVRSIELKIDGLGLGLEQVLATEREAAVAETAESQRNSAVEIWAAVIQRAWQTEALDKAFDHLESLIELIDRGGQDITLMASGRFGQDPVGQTNLMAFLANIDAVDLTDTVRRVRQDIGHPQRYAGGLQMARPAAIRALATAWPEILDEEVRKAAHVAAMRAQGTLDEPGDDDL